MPLPPGRRIRTTATVVLGFALDVHECAEHGAAGRKQDRHIGGRLVQPDQWADMAVVLDDRDLAAVALHYLRIGQRDAEAEQRTRRRERAEVYNGLVQCSACRLARPPQRAPGSGADEPGADGPGLARHHARESAIRIRDDHQRLRFAVVRVGRVTLVVFCRDQQPDPLCVADRFAADVHQPAAHDGLVVGNAIAETDVDRAEVQVLTRHGRPHDAPPVVESLGVAIAHLL
ncbi:MAG: hypothetical protein AB7S36_05235, partial [Planctomycetota bacterium]